MTSLGLAMNDWKSPAGGGGRKYRGPNGTAEKVDYSQLPIGGGGSDDDDGGNDDWIQRQIRGHKVRVKHVAVAMRCHRREAFAPIVIRDVVHNSALYTAVDNRAAVDRQILQISHAARFAKLDEKSRNRSTAFAR